MWTACPARSPCWGLGQGQAACFAVGLGMPQATLMSAALVSASVLRPARCARVALRSSIFALRFSRALKFGGLSRAASCCGLPCMSWFKKSVAYVHAHGKVNLSAAATAASPAAAGDQDSGAGRDDHAEPWKIPPLVERVDCLTPGSVGDHATHRFCVHAACPFHPSHPPAARGRLGPAPPRYPSRTVGGHHREQGGA